jgi:hypothetical protein
VLDVIGGSPRLGDGASLEVKIASISSYCTFIVNVSFLPLVVEAIADAATCGTLARPGTMKLHSPLRYRLQQLVSSRSCSMKMWLNSDKLNGNLSISGMAIPHLVLVARARGFS